jgi:5'-nucleotidase
VTVKLFVYITILVVSAESATAEYSLNILHTNDFHARFEPISKYDSSWEAEDNTAGKCFGGSARLVAAVAQARQRAANSIWLVAAINFRGRCFILTTKAS